MEDLFVKAATVIAVALATFSSFPGTAQQQDTPQRQQSAPVSPVAPNATPQSQARQGSDETSPAAAQLKPVSGELVDKLDSKSARQGDSVVVKTDQALTISEGTEIPKGSKLVGHITNVQARGDGKENSQIAIQFDHAELKDGKTLPIESVIQSVAPAGGSQMADSNTGAFGTSQPPPVDAGAGTASGATNQRGNAGMNNTAPSQSTMDNRPSNSPNASPESQASGQTGAMNAPAAGSIVARNGNVAIRATAIPGVLLANDIHGLPFSNASGMLLGARRDVHLEGGTKITLAVAMAPQGAGSGMSR
jgi:hypothetical protein